MQTTLMKRRTALAYFAPLIGALLMATGKPCPEEMRAAVRSIAVKCGVPQEQLVLDEKGGVRFKPDAQTPYRKVACVLEQIEASKLRFEKVGIVGGPPFKE